MIRARVSPTTTWFVERNSEGSAETSDKLKFVVLSKELISIKDRR